jgi:hypothetical protein
MEVEEAYMYFTDGILIQLCSCGRKVQDSGGTDKKASQLEQQSLTKSSSMGTGQQLDSSYV